MKVLMVLNDPEVKRTMSLCFKLYWPEATLLSSTEGTEGMEMLVRESPDVVVLDLVPSGMDGFELLSKIRALSNVPIMVVTPRCEEMEKIRGLELGADDYIVKPFSDGEVVARVKALLRRAGLDGLTSHAPLAQGGFVLDFRSRAVTHRGEEINLSPTEYAILCQLVSNSGRTVSHGSLIEKVWGEEALRKTPNLLRVHIHRLREKLGDPQDNPQIIITVPGRGYKFNVPAS